MFTFVLSSKPKDTKPMVRAYLFNAYSRQHKEVMLEDGLDAIYKLLSNDEPKVNVTMFTCAFLGNGVDIFVDDEGLYNGYSHNNKTVINVTNIGQHQLAGNLLFVACDDEGDKAPLTDEQVAFVKKAIEESKTGSYYAM